MMDLYFWTTVNGYKARQMMEEVGLPHRLKPIAITKGEQRAPEFLKISPGHMIPALTDEEGPNGAKISLCESGAIIQYLAAKAKSPLYPNDPVKRLAVDQWFFFGVASYGPITQQVSLFQARFPEKIPSVQEHYRKHAADQMTTLDRRLGESKYLGGDDYTIADIANYSHVHNGDRMGIPLASLPNLKRWHDAIEARPAVQRAYAEI
jgi:GST-like protein